MTTLCLDCSTGISGDMTVAALLDLGADQDKLKKVLASLDEQGFEVKISRVQKAALDMMDFDVVLREDNHDHDMQYLFGHGTTGFARKNLKTKSAGWRRKALVDILCTREVGLKLNI